MYRGVHRVYNANTNIFVPGPIRSTYFWSMGRDKQHLRQESDQSDKRGESNIASESDKSCEHHSCTCHSARTCDCPAGTCADDNDDGECSTCKCYNCDCTSSNLPNKHGDSCTCPSCRDYNDYADYISTSTDSQGKRSGSRVRPGDEFRTTELSDCNATDPIEHITGIQSGVTV